MTKNKSSPGPQYSKSHSGPGHLLLPFYSVKLPIDHPRNYVCKDTCQSCSQTTLSASFASTLILITFTYAFSLLSISNSSFHASNAISAISSAKHVARTGVMSHFLFLLRHSIRKVRQLRDPCDCLIYLSDSTNLQFISLAFGDTHNLIRCITLSILFKTLVCPESLIYDFRPSACSALKTLNLRV